MLSLEPGTQNTIGLHIAENQSVNGRSYTRQPVAVLAITTTEPSLLGSHVVEVPRFFCANKWEQ